MKNKKNFSKLFLVFAVVFITCLLISNLAAYKMIDIKGLVITSGVLVFPITYIINDLIAEVYGYKRARFVIWLGFAMNLFLVLYFQLAILLPYPEYFQGQDAFASVFGNTARMLVASLSAYVVGSLVNAKIMEKMKKGKSLFSRCVTSTLFGELLDSILFVGIAFTFTYDLKVIITMILTQTVVKTVYEIIAYPVTKKVINKVKKKEGMING